jgi:hypothetical protein
MVRAIFQAIFQELLKYPETPPALAAAAKSTSTVTERANVY